jgi:hypothetical protein
MQKNYTGVVAKSGNGKIGKNVFSTYRPVGATCPSSCEFLNNGCYAQKYHSDLSAKHAPVDPERFDAEMTMKAMPIVMGKRKKPNLVRFHTSGDVLLHGEIQVDYIEMLVKWATIFIERIKVPVINYTHAWQMRGTEVLMNFTRASVHNVADAVEANAQGWHVAIAVRKDKIEQTKQELKNAGLHGVGCAFQTHGIQCEKCKLCVIKGSDKRVIMFWEHK